MVKEQVLSAFSDDVFQGIRDVPNVAGLDDFVLSREGQSIYQKLGYSSARTDFANPEKPPKIYYLAERPNYFQDYENWSALGRQVFGK